jgi:hypothetical protein
MEAVTAFDSDFQDAPGTMCAASARMLCRRAPSVAPSLKSVGLPRKNGGTSPNYSKSSKSARPAAAIDICVDSRALAVLPY